MFAGRHHPNNLKAALESRGCQVDALDIKLGGLHHDVLNPDVLNRLIFDISRIKYNFVWIATPCASFSVFWLEQNRTTLRTRHSPLGAPSLPKRWRNYVNKHNRLVDASIQLARAAHSAGATFIIENPVDRGQPGSHLFEQRFSEHAPLWLLPTVQSLQKDTSAIIVSFPQCYFNGKFQKWTSLMAAGPRASTLTCLSQATCTHDSHTKTRSGIDTLGRRTSEESGEYPPLLNACLAALLLKPQHSSSMAPSSAPRRTMPYPSYVTSPSSQVQTGLNSHNWRALPIAIPSSWPEHSKFVSSLSGEARQTTLRYVSRRRAEPASSLELFTRELPRSCLNSPRQSLSPKASSKIELPNGAPTGHIHISQLFYPGVYDAIKECILQLSSPLQSILSSREANSTITPPAGVTSVFKQEICQPEWARHTIWDTSNPLDCRPMQPIGVQNDDIPGPNAKFFIEWSRRLNWKDEDMIRQLTVTGAESRSSMCWDTVIHAHHTGARRYLLTAHEAIESDTAKGWIEPGRLDLWTVPARLIPKNVVKQSKWRLDSTGNLIVKEKYRITSDDSIAAAGSDSRNDCIDPSAWSDLTLPSILNLAEAVAIVKSNASPQGLQLPKQDLQRVALWALDLTDAYRMLRVSRLELWMQSFVWADGVRLDRRALFGSAHLVGLFQRVSTFLLAIAKRRISEFDRHHPYDATRSAWLAARASAGLSPTCSFADIYIDDSFGLTCLSPDEPVIGAKEGPLHISILLTVRLGGSVQVLLRHNVSRVQMHMHIACDTFNEAGWDTANDKQQLGMDVNLLGFSISTHGSGCIHVPEAKRLGMLRDISEQLTPSSKDDSVHRDKVETLVGRLSHLAMVASEGNAYLKPLFAMVNARRRGIIKSARRDGGWNYKHRLVKPKKLHIHGSTRPQKAYQMCLLWWRSAFNSGFSVPLVHKRCFPLPGEQGCAFLFTDAAREDGTGFGGFTFVSSLAEDGSRRTTMLYMSELWDHNVCKMLQQDELSMAAGEAFGAIAQMDSLCDALPGLSHIVVFSDSSASVQLLNSDNSASPQMDYLMRWFVKRRPSILTMAVHIPGKANRTSDALSRNIGHQFLMEAAATGCHLRRLRPAHECCSMLSIAISQDQRGTVFI